MTINQLQEHLHAVFGERNRKFMPQLVDRLILLNLAVAHLHDTVRKYPEDRAKLQVALARIMSWTFCVAQHIPHSNVGEALSIKYPLGRCGYCGKPSCGCGGGQRLVHSPGQPDLIQLAWSIQEWQQHFATVYGDTNFHRGLENCINRMFKEVSELFELYVGQFHVGADIPDFSYKFALEVADVIAWCCGVATLLGIDLEDVIITCYGNGCVKCQERVCRCKSFSMDMAGHLRVGSTTR